LRSKRTRATRTGSSSHAPSNLSSSQESA
jgi:hypothetical protein